MCGQPGTPRGAGLRGCGAAVYRLQGQCYGVARPSTSQAAAVLLLALSPSLCRTSYYLE
jgi:hypothetical protein